MNQPIRNNRAADLLSSVQEEDGLSLERLALLTRIPATALRDCRDHRVRLTMSEQLAIAKVVEPRVPRLARQARKLAAQASAGITMQDDGTRRHLIAPQQWS
jgi:hypothetical protein